MTSERKNNEVLYIRQQTGEYQNDRRQRAIGNVWVGVDTKSPSCLSPSYTLPPSTSDPDDPVVHCRIIIWAGILTASLSGLFGSSSSVTEETSELARYIDGCWVGGGVVKDVTDDTEPVREVKKLPIFLVSAGGCGDEAGERSDKDVGGDSGVARATGGLAAEPPPFQSLKLHLDELLVSSTFAGVVGGGGIFDGDDPVSPTRNSEI